MQVTFFSQQSVDVDEHIGKDDGERESGGEQRHAEHPVEHAVVVAS